MYNVKSLFISRDILQKASVLVLFFIFKLRAFLCVKRVLLFMLSGAGPTLPRSDG